MHIATKHRDRIRAAIKIELYKQRIRMFRSVTRDSETTLHVNDADDFFDSAERRLTDEIIEILKVGR